MRLISLISPILDPFLSKEYYYGKTFGLPQMLHGRSLPHPQYVTF
jgi:hypothetical protein